MLTAHAASSNVLHGPPPEYEQRAIVAGRRRVTNGRCVVNWFRDQQFTLRFF